MGERSTTEMLEDFKTTFQLPFEELKEIAKFKPNDSSEKRRKIARRLDVFRKEAKKISEDPVILKTLLCIFLHDLREGCFDKAIEGIIELQGNTKSVLPFFVVWAKIILGHLL